MRDWLFFQFARMLPYSIVEYYYIKYGKEHADLYVQIGYGGVKRKEYLRTLDGWIRWELQYARRGYCTLPLDEFIDMGGYGGHIHREDLRVRRGERERVILHSQNSIS